MTTSSSDVDHQKWSRHPTHVQGLYEAKQSYHVECTPKLNDMTKTTQSIVLFVDVRVFLLNTQNIEVMIRWLNDAKLTMLNT